MSEDWDFYALLVDDEPASIFLDLGIAEHAPIPGYETMGYVRVAMRMPKADGLSSEAEFDRLCLLEDNLVATICGSTGALYVGRNTSGGNRDFFFYLQCGIAFENAAASAMQGFGEYTFSAATRFDESWSSYFGFLFPSAMEQQRIANRRLLATLMNQGDRTDIARTIDHRLLFDKLTDLQNFAAFAERNCFAVTREGSTASLGLKISRCDVPANIDAVLLAFWETMLENHGRYDGWGCELMRVS